MSPLLKTRRFLPLFVTQFLGAFNDNIFKNALVMLIAYKLASDGNAQQLVTLAAGLFMLPYLLFSATAGQLADKYDRALLARRIKIAEIVIMSIGAAGFYLGNVYFLLFVLFCLGTQATFFSPIKYALLPQHLQDNELVLGNAYIEAGTFLAILAGTIAGGLLIISEFGTHFISAAILVCALGGYMAARGIPVAEAPVPSLAMNWNMAQETWRIMLHSCEQRRVRLSILGISWFWLVGATFLSQFPSFAKDVLHADETVVTLFLAIFSLGIGIGSFLCNRLLKGEVSAAYVAPAAAGLTLFTLDLVFASGAAAYTGGGVWLGAADFVKNFAGWRVLFDLLMIAISGGVYVVPLYAIMQHDSDPQYRARIIAGNNIFNALFMVAAAIGTMLMLVASFSVPQVFLVVAGLNALAAIVGRRLK